MDLKEAVELARSRVPILAATGTPEEGALLTLLDFARRAARECDDALAAQRKYPTPDLKAIVIEARAAGLLEE